MPKATKKDCSVILFDVNTKSREKSLQALMKICSYNFFSSSKDLTKLILVNSDITENRLNARYGGYEHINEACKEIVAYNPRIFSEMIESSGTGQANWLEAVLVGLENLSDEYEEVDGIVTYQLLFITDLSSPLAKYDATIKDKVVKYLNKLEAFFYIVGADIEVPFTIKNASHIQSWMKNLSVDPSNQNFTLVKDIIEKNKNIVICDYQVGCQLFFSYRKWSGSQPWQVPLGIGTGIQLPAQTMKILDEILQCKLTSTGRFGEMMWIDAEDESVEIPQENVISGIMRHEKFVQMPDNKIFKIATTRSFNVLCFTDSSNVPEYIMNGGGCYCVLPHSTSEKNEAFNVLVDCLAQQKKYVIARRVYNNNFLPKIVVLVPKPDHRPKCFYLTTLPFADDVRVSLKEKSVESAVKNEVSDEVYSFLDSLTIDGDNPGLRAPLGINMMQNVNTQKLINKAANKYLDKYMRLEEIDLDYLAETYSGEAVKSLKSIWVERRADEVKKEEDNGDGDNSDNDFDW